jgi:transcriptional regulator with XRE-family HTH domain
MRIKSQSKNSRNANNIEEDKMLRHILQREFDNRKKDDAKYTQKEFADFLGITGAYLSEILNGTKSGQRKATQFYEKLGLMESHKSHSLETLDPESREAYDNLRIIFESDDVETKMLIKHNLKQSVKVIEMKKALKPPEVANIISGKK